MAGSFLLACGCKGWVKSMGQLIHAQDLARNHGVEYTGDTFRFCPWCGKNFAKTALESAKAKDPFYQKAMSIISRLGWKGV
jgi:hypothetical protein